MLTDVVHSTVNARATTYPRLLAGSVGVLGLASLLVPEIVSVQFAACLALVTLVVSCLSISQRGTGGLLRPVSAYVLTVAVFHVGLAPYLALGMQPPFFGSHLEKDLLASPLLGRALLLSSASIAAISFFSFFVDSHFDRQIERTSRTQGPGVNKTRFRTVGSCLLWIGVGIWIAAGISALGVGFVGASYGEWLAEENPLVPHAYFLISMGVACTAVAQVRLFSLNNLPLLVFALLGLPIGLRNEVLIPVLVFFALSAATGRVVPGRRLLLGALAGLLAIGMVRDVREAGASQGLPVPNPSYVGRGLAEMGYSVNTVDFVLKWQGEGDGLLWGVTYWVPVERLVDNFIPVFHTPEVPDDERASETLVRNRVGPIGFSSVAEASRNFPAPLAAVFVGVEGVLLTVLERKRKSPRDLVLLAVVLNSLLLHARNSFTPVPLELVMGIAIAVVVVPFRKRGVW